jgi:hypothetical protein
MLASKENSASQCSKKNCHQIEPQGLAIDSHQNVFVADDYANIIVEYTPVFP